MKNRFQQNNEKPFIIEGDRMLITQFFSLESIPNMPTIKTAKLEQETQPGTEPAAAPVSNANGTDTTDDGFVRKDYRIASAGVIYGHGFPVEYPIEIIKQSIEIFPQRLSLFKDHWVWSVDGIAGFVENIRYNESTERPGIDGTVCVDAVNEPRLARNVQTGAANRDSVTWLTSWKQSHPMDPEDFWNCIGQTINNELVRVIITQILEVYEISLVWYGADHTAMSQKLNHYAQLNQQIKPFKQITQEVKMENELLNALFEQFNKLFQKGVVTLEQFKAELAALSQKIQEKDNTIKALETQAATLQQYKEQSEAFMATLRADVKRMKKVVNQGLDPLDEQAIDAADYPTLLATQKALEPRMDKMVQFKCTQCGSTNVERRSSMEQLPGESSATDQHGETRTEKPAKIGWAR